MARKKQSLACGGARQAFAKQDSNVGIGIPKSVTTSGKAESANSEVIAHSCIVAAL